MTYKGKEIGHPTLAQVTEFVLKMGYDFNPVDVYEHYKSMDFLTLKGSPIKTLEAMCNAYNGIYVENKRKAGRGEQCEKVKNIVSYQPQTFDYTPYKEQLEDRRWKSFREFVMIVRGCKCEVCGAKKNLQIHHLRYNKGCFAWEYNVKEVMVVCGKCHSEIHKK